MTVPISDAATILIVADRPHLEVLMVRRTPRATFAPSAWVFPGGRVDPLDLRYIDCTQGLTDRHASNMLEVDAGGLSWWITAVRETLEEAGLLLGLDHGEPIAAAARSMLKTDRAMFLSSLEQSDLRLDLSAIFDVARFITPPGPPRRFDTRFFLTHAPPDQSVTPDASEIVDFRWVRPSDAIAFSGDGEFPLMSVTQRMLACISRYKSASHLLDAAARRPPIQRVRVIDPVGSYRVVLPGDEGYETAELEIEHGWVRI